jgi:L-aminopeptidase/D-esterase-like protein
VCVMTDAKLDRTQAWLVARAASAGVARAVTPSATVFDGDVALCLATGEVEVEPFAVTCLAADVVAAAIRDGARQTAATWHHRASPPGARPSL